MTFGDKLKKLCEEQAVDINYLASKLNVRRESIWRWQNNKSKPSCKYIREIAKIFKVDVRYLTN